MVANNPGAPAPAELLSDLLDRGYTTATRQVIASLARDTETGPLADRLKAFDEHVAQLAASGQTMSADDAYLKALLAEFGNSLRKGSLLIDAAAPDVQQVGIDAAGNFVRQTTLPGFSDQQLASIGISWNKPDPEAVAQTVNYTSSDAWKAELAGYGDLENQVMMIAIRGIVAGQNPTTTARDILEAIKSLPLWRANNIMRSLQLTAYRDATVIEQLANADILEPEIIRIAALDARTCFPAGTLVQTAHGKKPIETIVPGDMVLTHTGAYHRVMAIMERDYSGDMVTLQSKRSTVTATANHPILVERGEMRDWMAAEQVRVGDRVFIQRDYISDQCNHRGGNIPIKRSVWNSNNNVSTREQPLVFSGIRFNTLVPVDPINFQSHISRWQKEIYRIAIQSRFLLKWFLDSLKTQSHVALRFGLSSIAAIATWTTKLLVSHCWHNPKFFSTSETIVNHRWTPTGFRTVDRFSSMFGEFLPTSATVGIFDGDSFTSYAANPVSVGIGSRNTKFFTANGACLSNVSPVMPAFGTAKANIMFGNFRMAEFKAVTADSANKRNSFLLTDTTASIAAMHSNVGVATGFSASGKEFLFADGACAFDHDDILSVSTRHEQTIVYNLEVEEDHSYVANGIVVHNCMACVVLHGTKLRIGERVNDHRLGRCTSITQLKGRPRTIRTGIDWFNGLNDSQQQQQMGAAAWAAWKDGAINLQDFPKPAMDKVFGQVILEASLKGMLGDAARNYYQNGRGG